MPDLDRYLSVRSASGGATTADGATVVFLSTITGVPQVWAVPAGGGWPDQVTFADQRVGEVVPSPVDPATVVFLRDDGGNERMQVHAAAPDGTGERDLVVDPGVIHRFGGFAADGSWFAYAHNGRNGVDFDLWRSDLAGDRTSIARLPGWNQPVAVSPDGASVLVGHFASNVDSSVWLVATSDGAVTDLTPHDGTEANTPVGFSEDGAVFLVSDRAGEFRRAWRVRDGSWDVFGPERDVDALAVRHGLGAIAWNEDGRSRLSWFDAGTLALTTEVVIPMGVVAGLEPAPDGRSMLFTFSGPRHNPDVWRVAAGAATAERVTRSSSAGIDPGSFVEPEAIAVASFDGLAVPAWLYRPPGVVRPPVIVSVHGGPESQERPVFNPVHQYFVAAGYAVVAPNVRGSSGYGKTYLSLDDRRKRMDSVADLVAVGEWVRARDDLDGSRMAVMGGSYGGFMVLAALTTAPDLWAAGVDIVGIANFVTFLENTGAYRRALREAEYGSLADDREFLEAISPINAVERIAAPLLVIHGRNDPRVPLGEAEQIVDRLRALGREVDLLVFDDEGHGIVKLVNRRLAYGRVAAFLERILVNR